MRSTGCRDRVLPPGAPRTGFLPRKKDVLSGWISTGGGGLYIYICTYRYIDR